VTSRKRRWILFSGVVGVVVAGLIALAARIPFSANIMRSRVGQALAQQLDAEVEIGNLSLRIAPTLHAEAENLVIRHKGRKDVPPLIAVKTVNVDASLVGLWRKRVDNVKLEGLEITIPPGGMNQDQGEKDGDTNTGASPPSAAGAPNPKKDGEAVQHGFEDDGTPKFGRDVVIEHVVADNATLTILRRDPNKKSRVWQMHELSVQQLGARTEMPFQTRLTNAVPPGQITTTGSLGPWHRDDPGHTPISGDFTFENADLSVFKGISGILSAEGMYKGSLERIDVSGVTNTPEFMINISGHKVPLKAAYQATVDATNGNTTLDRIDAQFLETTLLATGGVYEVEGIKGRVVTLDVEITKGRLEDVMQLAVKTPQPPMTGGLHLNTKLEIPPGSEDVVHKLRLDGAFTIDNGRFTNAEVQQKINELSHRARGKKLEEPRSKVGSQFSGRFKLGNAALTLAKLTFDVPGAIVELDGQYGLTTEKLGFAGNLFMDAKVSQTVSGWKSLVLKMVDPLFRKDGRTVIPIKIQGTRDKPQFGLDAKRVF
jgi:hypothetical protein